MNSATTKNPYRDYRKFEILVRDLLAAIDSAGPDRLGRLWHCASQVMRFCDELADHPSKMAQIIEATCLLRTSGGPGVVVAETEIMSGLSFLAHHCAERLLVQPEDDANAVVDPDAAKIDEARYAVLEQLVAFAYDCFAFKRPRDSYSAKRRAEAFAILAQASKILALPDAIARARQTIQKSKLSEEISGAIEFLEIYFGDHDEAVDAELEADLKNFASRTDRRSLAVGALNVLVVANTISEWEALDRIDAWKDAHIGAEGDFPY